MYCCKLFKTHNQIVTSCITCFKLFTYIYIFHTNTTQENKRKITKHWKTKYEKQNHVANTLPLNPIK